MPARIISLLLCLSLCLFRSVTGGDLEGLDRTVPPSLRWETAHGHVSLIFGKHCSYIGYDVYTLYIFPLKVRFKPESAVKMIKWDEMTKKGH